jgi:hypothetical protein
MTLDNMEQLGLIKKYDGSPPFAAIRKALRLIVSDINEKDPKDVAYVYSGYAPLSIRLVEAAVKNEWQLKEIRKLKDHLGQIVFEYSVTQDALKTDVENRAKEEADSERPSSVPTSAKATEDKGKDPKRRSESTTMGSLVKGRSSVVMGTLGVLGAATTSATLSAMSSITPVITGGLVGGALVGGALVSQPPLVLTSPSPVVMVFFIGGCTYTEIAALRWLSKQPGSARYIIGTTKLTNGYLLLEDLME